MFYCYYINKNIISINKLQLDSKDLKVVSTFINSLNSGDGTPFSEGSEFKKPNFRLVSQAAVQELEPKQILRLAKIASMKLEFGPKRKARHFSKSLRTSIKKWLLFREQNLKGIEGIKKAGLTKIYQNIYRMVQMKPAKKVAEILRWKQKDGSVTKVEKKTFLL